MESSRSDGLGKLLPKSITDKRRRRKQKQSEATDGLHPTSSSLGDSDETNSASNMADDDDDNNNYNGNDRSLHDDRSFGSFESGPDPESRPASTSASASKESSKKSSKSASRNPSESPSRPGPASQPPSSLIGNLTTASPTVEAALFDRPSQSQLPSQAAQPVSRGSRRPSATATAATDPPVDQALIGPPPTAAKVAPPTGRSRVPRDLDNRTIPPLTPSATPDRTAPAIVNTPPTPTHQSPFEDKRTATWKSSSTSSNFDGVPSRVLKPHKRSSSASATIGPSKLSAASTNPLTPTLEGSETGPNTNAGSGFFSSMISAAQSAATNFSSNIQNTGIGIGGNKGRATPSKPQASRSASQAEVEPAPAAEVSDTMDQKDSAVRTLGAGDLSLSHLGLDEPASPVASPSSARFTDVDNTRARSESAPADTQTSNGELVPEGADSRPQSLNESPNGEATPPPPQIECDDRYVVQRAGSLRSSHKAHRKRGSSVTTSGTGMNLAPAVSSPMHPAANLSTPKLTGFAIASKKRNRDFHTIFKSVPDDDYLIEDYSCALQREILAHGRLYVSEGHLCFSSNILGWTTTLVMSFDEIVSVEKRSTALVFKNGLLISTLHAKHVFASFTSRDATYDLIVNIWKLGHPTLTSTQNGVRLEGTGGDKTEKTDAGPAATETDTQLESDSDEESEEEGEEFYDEEANDEDLDDDVADPTADGEPEKAVTRKTSGMTTNGAPPTQKDVATFVNSAEFPGPTAHPPTDCGDSSTHYEKVVGDDIIAAPLGKVYSLMFGQGSAAFMAKFLTSDQKCTDVQMDDKRGLGLENRSRTYTYIKPLYAAIGPKSTKCVITETLDNLDFEKAANMTMSTQTPEAPSGNVFVVKTKYCLSWAENNSTRVQVNCTIEWTGKSWIKGPIEKAANEGQADHCKAIFAFLRTVISSRTRAGTGTNGAAKARRKGKKSKASRSALEAADKAVPTNAAKQNWGALEPVHQLMEPFADLVKPLLTGNVMYGLLVGLLVATWFGFGFTPSRNVAPYGPHGDMYGSDRLAAYEEIWRREDSELWEWLEERIGLDQLNTDRGNARKKSMQARSAEEKVREERMDVREVEEAMQVTEEKLKILQEAMGKASRVPEGAGYSHSDGL